MSPWTKDRQMELYRRHNRKALKRAVRYMKDDEEAILALAGERMEEGFEQYGDRMFQWPHHELQRNKREEAADLVVYIIAEIARGW